MKLPVLTYDCDGCGLCCEQLLSLFTRIDAAREPRIRKECRRVVVAGKAVDRWMGSTVSDDGMDIGPCIFLGADKRCGIYGTRPNTCVGFEAGSPDCQRLRAEAGLEPLAPRTYESDEITVTFERMPEMKGHGLINGQESVG